MQENTEQPDEQITQEEGEVANAEKQLEKSSDDEQQGSESPTAEGDADSLADSSDEAGEDIEPVEEARKQKRVKVNGRYITIEETEDGKFVITDGPPALKGKFITKKQSALLEDGQSYINTHLFTTTNPTYNTMRLLSEEFGLWQYKKLKEEENG